MLSISGIILGLGYVLDDKRLKEIGKNEIYQSVINGALVGGLLLLFASSGILTSIINSVTLSNNLAFSCPGYMDANAALCFSYSYLVGVQGYSISGVQYSSLFITISTLLAEMFALSTALGVIAAVKLNLLIISISFSSILGPIIGELQYVMKIMTTLAIGVTVQAAFISFIAVTATTIILPTGMILRPRN